MEEAIFQILTGTPAVAAIANDSVFPLELPQGLEFRGAITYTQISGPRDHAQGGATGLVESRYHFLCQGKKDDNGSAYQNAKLLSRAVRDLFLPQTGGGFRKTVANTEIQGIFINNERDMRSEGAAAEGGVAGVLFDCTIWHKE